MTATPPKPPKKKSELLEVRLDHESKRDFLAECRTAGRTASDVVREQIARWVEEQRAGKPARKERPKGQVLAFVPRPLRKKRWAALGAGAVAIAALGAAPVAAQVSPLKPVFDRLDSNKDGTVSQEEFSDAALPNVAYFHAATLDGDDRRRDIVIRMRPTWDSPDPPRRVRAAPSSDAAKAMTFARFDADASGVVNFEEFERACLDQLRAGFESLDSNRDGVLTQADERQLQITAESVTTTGQMVDGSVDDIRRFDRDGDGKVMFAEYVM